MTAPTEQFRAARDVLIEHPAVVEAAIVPATRPPGEYRDEDFG